MNVSSVSSTSALAPSASSEEAWARLNNEATSSLTASDLDVINAATGRKFAKAADGSTYDTEIKPPLPPGTPVPMPDMALTIANDRTSGALKAGQPVSATYFKNWINPAQSADWNAEMQRADDFLNTKSTTATSTVQQHGRLDVTG